MGWESYRRRKRALDAVIERAWRTGEHALPPIEGALATEFGSVEELRDALCYRWSLLLTARIDLAIEDAAAQADVGERAHASCAAANPGLWTLVEPHHGARAHGIPALTRALSSAGDTPRVEDRLPHPVGR
ncbi:hypothetical protein [Allosaccharopolyspora coralli]|uniref:hypothetical protein n=1 Tax=Allosaccharopolyspora coralli TaxID=2665642 RepID=UPI001E381BA8|nr:hypothetical protein [Allosaccharopolyspora coralli]